MILKQVLSPGMVSSLLFSHQLLIMDVGLTNEMILNFDSAVQNVTVRVAAYTDAGDGPWSRALMVSSSDVGKE